MCIRDREAAGDELFPLLFRQNSLRGGIGGEYPFVGSQDENGFGVGKPHPIRRTHLDGIQGLRGFPQIQDSAGEPEQLGEMCIRDRDGGAADGAGR